MVPQLELWEYWGHGYWISEGGRLFSEHSDGLLGGYVGPNGYLYYTFRDKSRHYAHRLVATKFVKGFYPHLVVNHKDHDKLNNHYTNLEWVTQAANVEHSYTNSQRNRPKSYNHSRSKLSAEQACAIYVSKKSVSQLAKEYSVDWNVVSGIKKGVRYTWATKELLSEMLN
jgi:hypothetical protein